VPRNTYRNLGRTIGENRRRIKSLEEGAGPSETDTNFILQSFDDVLLSQNINIYKFELCDDAFVLDHPTQGKLDDPDLKLDHGYCEVTKVQRDTDYTFIGTS